MTVHRYNFYLAHATNFYLSKVPCRLHWSRVEPAWARFSSSTSRWKQRQGRDAYARDARVQGLKSRAAFKLLEVRRRAIFELACKLLTDVVVIRTELRHSWMPSTGSSERAKPSSIWQVPSAYWAMHGPYLR
jgi:hypothetical protein